MSQLKEKYTKEYIRDNNLILGETLIGSYAFGLQTETSDRDIYGVFFMEHDDLLSLRYITDETYKDVVEKKNKEDQDITFMEVGKFFQLLANGNPNALEILASMYEIKNVIYLNDLLKGIDMSKILTKQCRKSFTEYAASQIAKARGLNKAIVNPVDKDRKTPLDFCRLMSNGKTLDLRKWLRENYGMDQKFCGVVALSNARDSYALYYDWVSDQLFSDSPMCLSEFERKNIKEKRKEQGLPMGYGFKGIEMENSNEIRLSSVPKLDSIPEGEIEYLGNISYNKDGYIRHCKDYKKYWDWVENRNEERYNNNLKQNYDTKNISHCIRLLSVAKEIAEGKGIILQRTYDRQFLMDVKLGKVEYDDALSYAEKILNDLESLYNNSTLPEVSDFKYLDAKLIEIRKQLYNEQYNTLPN